jgi:ACS family hexuronate transporter-like MFS transporter
MRWLAVSVFIVSTTLNYLDRQLLSALAPLVLREFHLNQTQYGWLVSAFSITYAAAALFMGYFLDRAGINRGITVAAACWSAAAASIGLTRSFASLAVCRAALGAAESASVPAVGKLNGIYLKPQERALGAALNQVGISLGLALAPAFIGLAIHYGWRVPFVFAGCAGLLWIPLWLLVSRRIPPSNPDLILQRASPDLRLLLNRDLLLLVAVNVLWMGTYSLWSSWTTLYLMGVHHLTLEQTRGYVWIPPLLASVGGFFGGWLSLVWMNRGANAINARRNAIYVSAAGTLSTLLLPLAKSPAQATALICASFFFVLAGSVNIYALPIDLYGPGRSGLAISALVLSFGLMQAAISPIIGHLSDLHLYKQVVYLVAIPPLLSCLLMMGIRSISPAPAS